MFKEININSIRVKGFKGYKEYKEIELFKLTQIIGDNGKGKTTIGEAIAWGFLGSNLFGNNKVDSLLLNDTSKIMEVEINFNDGKDNHTLKRTRYKETSITLDGLPITQADLTCQMGSKSIFLSILNPEYFQTLSEKDGRDYLVSILDKVDKDEVIAEMDETSIDFIREEINLVDGNPNEYNKQRRAEIKELETDLVFIEGVMSKLNTSYEKKDLKVFDDTELVSLEKELDNLQYNKTEPNTEEFEKLIKEKVQLEKKIITTEAQQFNKVDLTEKYKSLMDYEKNIAILESEKFEVKEESLKQKLTLETEADSLRKAYRKLREIPLQEGEHCPTCKTEITHYHLEILKDNIGGELADLAVKGKEKNQQLKELSESIESSRNAFETIKDKKLSEFREKHSTLSKEIKEIELDNIENEAIFNTEKAENILAYNEKIKEIQAEMDSIKEKYLDEERAKLAELETTRNSIKEKLQELRIAKNEVDAYNLQVKFDEEKFQKDTNEKIKLSLEIKNTLDKIVDSKSKIDSCNQYTAIKVTKLSEAIHSNLQDVSIILQKVVKSTGELKDCFEVRYKDKDYKVISASEKIRTGLEIANLVLNVMDVKYPIFIDNKESITSYEAPDTQIIEAKVVEGLEILQVINKVPIEPEQLDMAI